MEHEIVITGPMYPDTIRQLEAGFHAHRLWEAKDKPALLAGVKDRVRAIATVGAIGANAALMDQLPKLELIAAFAVGVDTIDLEAAKARGIAVTNTPDVLTDEVADLAITLVLASARLVVRADRYVRAGKWLQGSLELGRKVRGRKLGIVGFGRIGRAVARSAAAFDMEIAYHGPRAKTDTAHRYYPDLVGLARDVDFLVVTSPGGPATRHLINAEVLAALGKKGTLVNVARGSVVDEAALVKALQDDSLGAAALDVFANEPKVPEALLTMENVILQPHQASATHETRAAMGQLVVDNLKAFFAGQPLLTRVV